MTIGRSALGAYLGVVQLLFGMTWFVYVIFLPSLLEKAGLASEFSGDRLGRMQLPDDDLDRPKRYNLSDSDGRTLALPDL